MWQTGRGGIRNFLEEGEKAEKKVGEKKFLIKNRFIFISSLITTSVFKDL